MEFNPAQITTVPAGLTEAEGFAIVIVVAEETALPQEEFI